MQAGRELDALVAEKVMGLLPCSDPIGRCDGAKSTPCQCWGTADNLGVVVGGELACYSTSVEAAWQVVEKMRGDGFEPCVNGECWTPKAYRSGAWFADFQHNDLSRRRCNQRDADTAPLAICIAALAAVGVEVS